MLPMKISKSWIYKIVLIISLVFSAQLSFAGDDVPIPPDDSQPNPGHPNALTIEPSATATISETELAVFFEYSVGDATITVYDADNNVVYQETVDTTTTYEVNIPVTGWDEGDYMITVTYGTTTQRGYFTI